MARETPRGQLPPTNPACGRLREHTARLALASVAVRSVARFAGVNAARSLARFSLRSSAPGGYRPYILSRSLGIRGHKAANGFKNAHETLRGHHLLVNPACGRFSLCSLREHTARLAVRPVARFARVGAVRSFTRLAHERGSVLPEK